MFFEMFLRHSCAEIFDWRDHPPRTTKSKRRLTEISESSAFFSAVFCQEEGSISQALKSGGRCIPPAGRERIFSMRNG